MTSRELARARHFELRSQKLPPHRPPNSLLSLAFSSGGRFSIHPIFNSHVLFFIPVKKRHVARRREKHYTADCRPTWKYPDGRFRKKKRRKPQQENKKINSIQNIKTHSLYDLITHLLFGYDRSWARSKQNIKALATGATESRTHTLTHIRSAQDKIKRERERESGNKSTSPAKSSIEIGTNFPPTRQPERVGKKTHTQSKETNNTTLAYIHGRLLCSFSVSSLRRRRRQSQFFLL